MAGFLEKIKRSTIFNPILLKELRLGLREKRVFITQTIYLLVLGIISFVFLLESTRSYTYQYDPEAGRNFFKVLCIFQWILIVLISPSLTSTSFSSEKEKKTYDMLLVTLLSAPEIVIGKLSYAMSYLILLLASSLPLVALVFLVGGVTPLEILINYASLLVWGAMVAMLALFFSSREHRSSVATSQSYGVIILFSFFLGSQYLIHFFHPTGLFIGYSLKLPEMIGWLVVYFDILWVFLFLFYKTANNIRPSANTIIGLHRLFIIGFLLNIVGGLASAVILQRTTGSYPGAGNPGEISSIWIIFSVVVLFFMGCFIERHKFISQKEEGILNRSISSKSYFFPLYFVGCAILLFSIFLAFSGDYFKLGASLFIFIFFLGAMVLITKEIFKILNERVRPSFIYYPLFIIINLIPLFSYVIMKSTSPPNKALSVFSMIFIQPIFTFLSIWHPDDEFGMVSIMGGIKVPTFILTLVFYTGFYLFIKMISMFLTMRRKAVQIVQEPTST